MANADSIHPNRHERAPSESALPWSAETALNELWTGLDTTETNGDVRAYIKKHLQAAYDAGRSAAYRR